MRIRRVGVRIHREIVGLWTTRTHGSPWLGERNYKDGKIVLFIRFDFFIWKVSILIKIIDFLLWNVFWKEEREMVVTGVFIIQLWGDLILNLLLFLYNIMVIRGRRERRTSFWVWSLYFHTGKLLLGFWEKGKDFESVLDLWERVWVCLDYQKNNPSIPLRSCDFYLRFGRWLVRFRGGWNFRRPSSDSGEAWTFRRE